MNHVSAGPPGEVLALDGRTSVVRPPETGSIWAIPLLKPTRYWEQVLAGPKLRLVTSDFCRPPLRGPVSSPSWSASSLRLEWSVSAPQSGPSSPAVTWPAGSWPWSCPSLASSWLECSGAHADSERALRLYRVLTVGGVPLQVPGGYPAAVLGVVPNTATPPTDNQGARPTPWAIGDQILLQGTGVDLHLHVLPIRGRWLLTSNNNRSR
jgi:hypothetical protein